MCHAYFLTRGTSFLYSSITLKGLYTGNQLLKYGVRTVYNTTWYLQVYELPFLSLKFRRGVLINAVVGPLPCGPSALLARSYTKMYVSLTVLSVHKVSKTCLYSPVC